MKTRQVKPVTEAKTAPPSQKGSYVAVTGDDGQEKWVLVATDAADGVTDADMDFEQGKRWAAEQQKKKTANS